MQPLKWLKDRLNNSTVFLTIYASSFIFFIYTIMYAYRKPFTVGLYSGESAFGLDGKIAFILAQIIGYALSKFIGIRFLPQVSHKYRKYCIILCLFISWISLLGFALLPIDLKVISMFLNGLPLGVIWGLIMSYMEGRKISEVLNVGLSVTFIISSGIVKSFAIFIMETFSITEYWTPFVVGAFCFIPLVISVYMLDLIPAPSEADIQMRTKRSTMTKVEQSAFFKKLAFGIIALVLFYGTLTVFRELRDSFSADFWTELGGYDVAIFTTTELPIAIILTLLLSGMVFVKNNRRALNILYAYGLIGGVIMLVSTILYYHDLISPVIWMIISGTGLYMGYIPFTFIIERLIASLKVVSTAVFIVYIGDAVGYFGCAGVFMLKNFSTIQFSWNEIMIYTSLCVSIVSIVSIIATYFYFEKQFASKDFLQSQDH